MQDPRDPRPEDEASADPLASSDTTAPPPDPVEPPAPPPVEPAPTSAAYSEPVITASDPVPPSAPPPSREPAATGERPMGITVLAILAAIAGVFGIFGGLLLMTTGAVVGAAAGSAGLAGLAAFLGAVTLGVAIAYIIFAWGAWGLKPWGWTLGIVLSAISIVLGLFNLINGGGFSSIIQIAIAAAITYYLFTPEVKAAFGRT